MEVHAESGGEERVGVWREDALLGVSGEACLRKVFKSMARVTNGEKKPEGTSH